MANVGRRAGGLEEAERGFKDMASLYGILFPTVPSIQVTSSGYSNHALILSLSLKILRCEPNYHIITCLELRTKL